jgi:LPS export ABC transporter protein LptC
MTRLKIIILALICLLAGATLLTIKFSHLGEDEGPLPTIETEADLTSKNIHLMGDTSGLKEWELEAREARHFLTENMTVLEGIEASFYVREGGLIRLRGDRGRVHHATRDIEVQGNIVILTDDGYQLRTDGLQYVDGARRITSSDPVEIAGDGLAITGDGMCIDLVTGRLSMGGRVETLLSAALRGWDGMMPGWRQ